MKARNYKREYDMYQGSPEQIENRSQRNKARRIAMREGLVRKGDGRDVDHRVPISQGGKNVRSNLRVKTASDNRSFQRTPTGKVKYND
jgi:hypothetical protein